MFSSSCMLYFRSNERKIKCCVRIDNRQWFFLLFLSLFSFGLSSLPFSFALYLSFSASAFHPVFSSFPLLSLIIVTIMVPILCRADHAKQMTRSVQVMSPAHCLGEETRFIKGRLFYFLGGWSHHFPDNEFCIYSKDEIYEAWVEEIREKFLRLLNVRFFIAKLDWKLLAKIDLVLPTSGI